MHINDSEEMVEMKHEMSEMRQTIAELREQLKDSGKKMVAFSNHKPLCSLAADSCMSLDVCQVGTAGWGPEA